jgi:hypothetical protein
MTEYVRDRGNIAKNTAPAQTVKTTVSAGAIGTGAKKGSFLKLWQMHSI